MVIGDAHIDFILAYVNVFVDFKKITAPSRSLLALSHMFPMCPWWKVCQIADFYASDPMCKTGGKGIANNWNKATLSEITQNFNAVDAKAMEDYVSEFLRHYKHPVEGSIRGSISAELAHKLRCRFVTQAGVVLRTPKKRADWRNELSNIEETLRKKCQWP